MIITVEGNIGSGKSTILKHLEFLKNDNIVFVPEPVAEWLNIKVNDKNVLELFYENQKENSFWFQILAYITRLRNFLDIVEKNPDKIIICERSIYTDKYVFAKMLHEAGNINEIEWITYCYWFDTFKDKTKVDTILYVNTEPDECYNRINKRSRPEEVNKISKDYLTMCHNKHLEWFTESDAEIIHINGHESVESVMNNVKSILDTLIDKNSQKE
jgi:deoxyadenosine/deoxycytidine kinase